MAGMTLSRDMSSNEHKANPMKMHIYKSQEVRGVSSKKLLGGPGRFFPQLRRLGFGGDINFPK